MIPLDVFLTDLDHRLHEVLNRAGINPLKQLHVRGDKSALGAADQEFKSLSFSLRICRAR